MHATQNLINMISAGILKIVLAPEYSLPCLLSPIIAWDGIGITFNFFKTLDSKDCLKLSQPPLSNTSLSTIVVHLGYKIWIRFMFCSYPSQRCSILFT